MNTDVSRAAVLAALHALQHELQCNGLTIEAEALWVRVTALRTACADWHGLTDEERNTFMNGVCHES